MTQDELVMQSFEMSLQALATAKATKRMLVPDAKQVEFTKQYQTCLKETIKGILSQHPELHLQESLQSLLED